MNTKFYNKNGDLSFYSLGCGYVQRSRTEKKQVDLFREYGVFHVKTYITDKEELRLNKWNTFDKLKDARKMFKNELRNN